MISPLLIDYFFLNWLIGFKEIIDESNFENIQKGIQKFSRFFRDSLFAANNTRKYYFNIVSLMRTSFTTGRVANITDFSVEVRNSENDPYFSRFLYKVLNFSEFLQILQFFDIFTIFYPQLGIITAVER